MVVIKQITRKREQNKTQKCKKVRKERAQSGKNRVKRGLFGCAKAIKKAGIWGNMAKKNMEIRIDFIIKRW